VKAGGELLVVCWLLPVPTGKPVRVYPHGHLHVFADRVVWKGGRRYPERTFIRGVWLCGARSSEYSLGKYGIVSLVNQQDTREHQEFRVPIPDLDLVRAVMGEG
jgi:hypothetical protein